MGDHRVYFDLAVHIPIHNFRHIRPPGRPPNAVPRHTRPVTSWNGRVLISAPAGATPMMMLSPQPLWAASRAVRITDTFARGVKGVICAPTGQFDKMGNQIALYLGWVDKIGHAKLLAHLYLARRSGRPQRFDQHPQGADLGSRSTRSRPEPNTMRGCRSRPWRC